jgi:hydrogenase maturation factor
MSTFDPATIRQAVAEFMPRRPQKFQDLLPAKDVIAELRQKRASYRAIAELLTKHCLPTSKTAIAVFCHEVLNEIVRPYRRPGRRRAATPTVPTGDAVVPAESTPLADPKGAPPTRTRGPRIAQVRMLTTETK